MLYLQLVMDRKQQWLNSVDSEFLVFLRSCSIMFIIIGHLGGWIFSPWSDSINLFVPIFFFISGIVSYNSYLSRKSIIEYLIKRCVKLLIPYYCVAIFSFFLFIFHNDKLPEFSLVHAYAWLFLIPKTILCRSH